MKSPLTAKEWRALGEAYECGHSQRGPCCARYGRDHVWNPSPPHEALAGYLVDLIMRADGDSFALLFRPDWYLAPTRALLCYLLAEYVASEEEGA